MIIYHILVDHKYEAEDLLSRLERGESFAELAQKYSKCASAKNSGLLGDMKNKMHLLDEDFRDACELLKHNQVSKPVRTKFGYHLILTIV